MYQPITVNRKSSLEERQSALQQIYYQTLERQPYDYERESLAKAEKDFLTDKIGVKRFLKELGHSEVYLNAFYYTFSNPKFIELCFKHFLGRAILEAEEMRLYCDLLIREGATTLISSILDSEEYRKAFGCFTVPYPQEQRVYASPKAYLESRFLNQEHFGQRGRSVPVLYWHQLGLVCEAGVCRYPEENEFAIASKNSWTYSSSMPNFSADEMDQLLQMLQSNPSEDAVSKVLARQEVLLKATY
jgi:hypothetical protein